MIKSYKEIESLFRELHDKEFMYVVLKEMNRREVSCKKCGYMSGKGVCDKYKSNISELKERCKQGENIASVFGCNFWCWEWME
jgi:hypothetical protein